MNWKPIATAPKNGNTIILGNATEVAVGQWAEEPKIRGDTVPSCWMAQIVDEDTWYSCRLHFEPTHWMPLPNPPP